MTETRFEWDPKKSRANLRKHGVSFEMAKEVFDDPHQLVMENDARLDEQRYHIIGLTRASALLLVVFVDRGSWGVERIRIISARRANAFEESAYGDQFR